MANAVSDPFEVISAEDMLSRVSSCNAKLEALKTSRGRDWKWMDEYVLLGTDVKGQGKLSDISS